MPHLLTPRTLTLAGLAAGAAVAVGVVTAYPGMAVFDPGTPGRDVHIGRDDDNAGNPLIQPPGVSVPQHMDDADVMFGRDGDDLLIGRRGSDTLLGGPGSDILVGGPDGGRSGRNDTLIGEDGDDLAIWSPGDGNDAFAGEDGVDALILGLADRSGPSLGLTAYGPRRIPRVDVTGRTGTSCTIVPVSLDGAPVDQYLIRYLVGGSPIASIRVKNVEKAYCATGSAGKVLVATLAGDAPTFAPVSEASVPGLVGAILR
ncbi:MAG: hypothetical protein U0Q21_12545 [Dermatophilaceae bacterium]